jgi:hypothetical protein
MHHADFSAPVTQQDRLRHPIASTRLRTTLLSVPTRDYPGMFVDRGRQVGVVLYVVAMMAVIVGVDIAFFRNRFWERLAVNIGIVLVFAAFYFRFLRRS